MKQSVRDNVVDFNGKLEGIVRKPYVDVLNLVTIAIGNLVDSSPGPTPWAPAVSLPFVREDGLLASAADITAAWLAVKNTPVITVPTGRRNSDGSLVMVSGKPETKQMHAAAHYGHLYAATVPGNNISLTDAGIEEVVFMRLDSNHTILARRFPDIEEWPADAQLATHSMAWACGANFHFPLLEASLKSREFATLSIDANGEEHVTGGAAFHCTMRTEGNPGLIPRNAANKTLYANAARVVDRELDFDTLFFPTVLSSSLT